jgi:hypothetical protein
VLRVLTKSDRQLLEAGDAVRVNVKEASRVLHLTHLVRGLHDFLAGPLYIVRLALAHYIFFEIESDLRQERLYNGVWCVESLFLLFLAVLLGKSLLFPEFLFLDTPLLLLDSCLDLC